MPYKDKDRQREASRAYAQSRRDAWFSGKSCAECGSVDRLEADHIDPSTKVYSPSALWTMADDNPNRVAELAKLQVLCYDCHKKKTQKDKEAAHGTVGRYSRYGCRCDLCKNAWNSYKRKNRARRKLLGLPAQ